MSEKENKMIEWDRERSELVGHEEISIYEGGRIGIPSEVVSDYFENDEGARLFVNKGKTKLGIKPSNVEHPNAYKVSSSNSTAQISCKTFLQNNSLLPSETDSFPVSWDENQEMLVATIWNKEK